MSLEYSPHLDTLDYSRHPHHVLDSDSDTGSESGSESLPDTNHKDGSGSKFKRKYNKRKAIVFLIDGRKKMFEHNNSMEEETPIMKSLKCVRNAMRRKIWVSDGILCTVALIGTKEKNHCFHFENMYVALPLQKLCAEHILACDDIIKAIQNSTYDAKYGCGEVDLGDALWLGFKMVYNDGKGSNMNMSVILFTNDDNPTNGNNNLFWRILQKGRDYLLFNMKFDLVYLGKNSKSITVFKELLDIFHQDLLFDASTSCEEIVQRINKADFHHSQLPVIPFFIVNGFKIDVSINFLVRKTKYQQKCKLHKATNKVIKTRTAYFETSTGKSVKKEDLIWCYEVGGKQIMFSSAEKKRIEQSVAKGLTLMGFKPASSVILEHYVKPCAFIYPSNPSEPESAFFAALWTRCLQRNVTPICTLSVRGTSNIDYVALIPQEEEKSAAGGQIFPPGFLVFFLPFADDVRDVDLKCTGRHHASQEEVDLAKKLIKKLKFKYTPNMFSNPKLGSHLSAVEALALNLRKAEPFSDTTLPNYDMINSRISDIKDKFVNKVYTDDYDPETSVPARKPKTRKAIAKSSEMDVDDIELAIKSGDAQLLTIDALKMYLQRIGHGQGISKMKKSNLIERACNHLGVPIP